MTTPASHPSEFLRTVNHMCDDISWAVEDSQSAHRQFMLECAREQIKRVDPTARSYGVVAQLVNTDPRKW